MGGEDGVLKPVVRTARRSDFWLGDTGTDDGTSAAGMEKPTTDDVGRVFWDFDDDAAALVDGRRRDAHDFGGGFAMVGDTAGGAGVAGNIVSSFGVATVSTLGDCGDDLPLLGDTAAKDNEVFVDCGDPGIGVSGAVEHAGVVSVAEEDGTSASSGDARMDSFDSPST